MPRIDLAIATPDGTCPAGLHVPDGDGPWPGVILYPDAGGRREVMAAMADHLAGFGYAVLLPDVYYREGDWAPFDVATVFSDDGERRRVMGMVASLTADRVAADAGAFLDELAGRPEVTGRLAGTTGYCMGGRISLIAAGHHPTRIGAAASFHGSRLAADDPESPHRLADRIAATVYVAAAEQDDSFPAEQRERLESVLTTAGVPHTIETYPARHGFAVPDNPTFDAAAQERHWAALERLYATALR